jgi:alpha-tubulin suppressor-like RCC1 family protein
MALGGHFPLPDRRRGTMMVFLMVVSIRRLLNGKAASPIAVLALLCCVALPMLTDADAINITNMSEPFAQLQVDNVPLEIGFVAVGYSTLSHEELSAPSVRDALAADFTPFPTADGGLMIAAGVLNANDPDLPSGHFQIRFQPGDLNPLIGKPIFLIGGDGTGIADSDHLFIYAAGTVPAAQPPFFEWFGTIILNGTEGGSLLLGTVAGEHSLATPENAHALSAIQLAPVGGSITALESSSSFQIAAPQGASWEVESLLPWITITSASSGTGNVNVSYTAVANHTGETRSGLIRVTFDSPVIDPIDHTVTQPAIDPETDIDNDGLKDIVETNTGTFVSENDTGTDPRSADSDGDTYDDGKEVTLGSNPLDPDSLPPFVNVIEITIEALGDSGSFEVNAPAGIEWTAASTVPWIIIERPSGTGHGSVSYTVIRNNTDEGRNAQIKVTPIAEPGQWEITTVDSEGEIERLLSLSHAPDGNSGIAYSDKSNNELKFAGYDGTTWHIDTVDSEGGVAPALCYNQDGRPAISYTRNSNLKYAEFDGENWNIQTLDSETSVHSYSSLSLDPAGHPAISYRVGSNAHLKYIEFDGENWEISYLDGSHGSGFSLNHGPDKHPAISYRTPYQDLKYTAYDGIHWRTITVDAKGSSGGITSLNYDSNGNPVIAYIGSNNTIRFTNHDNGQWNFQTIDFGSWPSLHHAPNGNPAIAYKGVRDDSNQHQSSDPLRFAEHDGERWRVETLLVAETVQPRPSLSHDANGNPTIAYVTSANTLAFAHRTSPPTFGADNHYSIFQPAITAEADSDGDGLKDIVETATGTFTSAIDTGTDPFLADSDGDGFNDGEEVSAFSDPNKDESFPITINLVQRNAEASGSPGSFAVSAPEDVAWSAESLVPWITITGAVGGTGNGTITYTVDSNSGTDTRDGQIVVREIPGAWEIETVIFGHFNEFIDLNHAPDGQPAIAYNRYIKDGQNGNDWDLEYVKYDGEDWTTSTVSRADETGSAHFRSLSLSHGPDGFPAISYCDRGLQNIKFAQFDGLSWQISTVDGGGPFGEYTALRHDANGNPAIAYGDNDNFNLKYAIHDGIQWHVQTIDTLDDVTPTPFGGNSVFSISLSFDPEGNPAIVYCIPSQPVWQQKCAVYDGETWQIQIVDSYTESAGAIFFGGPGNSISHASNGQPAIAYVRHDPEVENQDRNELAFATYDPFNDEWVSTTVDGSHSGPELGPLGFHPSISHGTNGYPAISYTQAILGTAEAPVKYAEFDGTTWTAITLPQTLIRFGSSPSLEHNPRGQPSISYVDNNNNLLFAKRNATPGPDIDSRHTVTQLAIDPNNGPIPVSIEPREDSSDPLGESKTFAVSAPTGVAWSAESLVPWITITGINNGSGNGEISYTVDRNNAAGERNGDIRIIQEGAIGGWQISTVDSEGNVGRNSSLSFNPKGQAVIAYWDKGNRALKYAVFDNETWLLSTVDSEGDVGYNFSFNYAPDGQPAFAYWNSGDEYELKYTKYDGANWVTRTIDNDGSGGATTSLSYGPNGHPAIVYTNEDRELKYAAFDGENWEVNAVNGDLGFAVAGVPEPGHNGNYSSLRHDPAGGQPVIAYYSEWHGGHLKYASLDGAIWTHSIVDESEQGVGQFACLKHGSNAHPAISYLDVGNKAVKYAFYDGNNWVTQTVGAADRRAQTSLNFDPDGQPSISYFDGNLKYASYDGEIWTIQTIDSNGSVGWSNSLNRGPNGQPAISYRDATNSALKFAYFIQPQPEGTPVHHTLTQPPIDPEADADGDGFNNGEEIARGSDPKDPESVPIALDPEGTTVGEFGDNQTLEINAQAGMAWTAQSLVPWITITGNPSGTGPGTISYTVDQNSGAEGRTGHIKVTQDAMSAGWEIETVDELEDERHLSLAYSPDGKPGIAYISKNQGFKYAELNDATWEIQGQETLPRGFAAHVSLSYTPDGQPAIAGTMHFGLLEYAQYNGESWQITSFGEQSRFTSLRHRPDGQPAIGFSDGNAVKYAVYDGDNWTIQTVDNGDPHGIKVLSLSHSPGGQAAIAYWGEWPLEGADGFQRPLKYAVFDGENWTSQLVDISDNFSPEASGWAHVSLQHDGNGHPAIAYSEGSGKFLRYATHDGEDWTITQVEESTDIAAPSLSFDPQGTPAISYYALNPGGNYSLRYAEKNTSEWNIVEPRGNAGWTGNSLAHSPVGQPTVAYESWVDDSSYLTFARRNIVQPAGTPVYLTLAQPAIDPEADTDGDGFNNGEEIARGFDPQDAQSFPIHLEPEANTADSLGISQTFAVNAPAGSAWSAESLVPWITITNRANGTGSGTLSYTVNRNSDAEERAGQIKITTVTGEWEITTVDSEGTTGHYPSLSYNSNNQPVIAYGEGKVIKTTNPWTYDSDLKYAVFDGENWNIQIVDSEGNAGSNPSLRHAPDGQPAIVYGQTNANLTFRNLRYAKFDGETWNIQNVINGSNVISAASLSYGSDGRPVIAYPENPPSNDHDNRDLKYAVYDGANWNIQTVDSGNLHDVSLSHDSDGNPAIAYFDNRNKDLKYAKYDGENWVIEIIDSEGRVGYTPSLSHAPDGHPAISYLDVTNETLKYAKFDGENWNIEIIDSEGEGGYATNTALNHGPDGHPAIVYRTGRDSNRVLKHATFDGNIWSIEKIHDAVQPGSTSLSHDSGGSPAIAYHYITDRDLKFARKVFNNPISDIPPVYFTLTQPAIDPGADTDGDGLKDIVETNTHIFVSGNDTGTDPRVADSDGDGYPDNQEVVGSSDPNDPESIPLLPPVFADQVFTLPENSAIETLVGELIASDANGDALTYSIEVNVDPDGNQVPAFRVDEERLLVMDPGDLDYERLPTLIIIARASDGSLATEATITINLTDDRQEDADGDGLTEAEEEDIHNTSDTNPDGDGDGYTDGEEVAAGVNPNDAESFPNEAPVFADQTFTLPENSAFETLIGELIASDPNRDALTYSIVTNVDSDGNQVPAFNHDKAQLRVMDPGDLDYENLPTLTLIARASDGSLANDATITIKLTDDRQEDADGDGLTEAEEEDIHNTSDTNPDGDGDGYTDGEEVAAGVNPNDAESFPNEAPIFADQSFTLPENSTFETLIGELIASDPNRDALTYSIVTNIDPNGNQVPAFNHDKAQLLVKDPGDLDYESLPTLTIVARASDGILANEATITINLTDDRQEDADGDGLTEAEEEDIHNTSDTNPDGDGDGFSDSEEVTAGTDPNNAEDFPPSVAITTLQQGSESPASPSEFQLTLSEPASREINVTLLLRGTALPGLDYTAPDGLSANNSLIVTFPAGSDTATITLPTLADQIIDPAELILAILRDGSQYNITPGEDRAQALIAAEGITAGSSGPGSHPRRTSGEFRNTYAFAAVKNTGSTVTWGAPSYGGDSGAVSEQLSSGVMRIYSSERSFAALRQDGSVVSWLLAVYGGDNSSVAGQLDSGVIDVFSTKRAFAALKENGSVVTWGPAEYGGDSSDAVIRLNGGVTRIFSTGTAFAALKEDGSVVTWGVNGGDISAVASQLSSGVTQIFSTSSAFAALKQDGSIVTWGLNSRGGFISNAIAESVASGVTQIFATDGAFAALKQDGSVVTWGRGVEGGDSRTVADGLSSNVIRIYSNPVAFAALKKNGSVITWGRDEKGGNSSAVAQALSGGVARIASTASAFAAIKNDGSVVTWGNQDYGGNSSTVSGRLGSGVLAIYSTESAFAALKEDGSVIIWGYARDGGDAGADAWRLTSGVTQIGATSQAFAAIKEDGSVITWGRSYRGGDSSDVAGELLDGVIALGDPLVNEPMPLAFTLEELKPIRLSVTVSPRWGVPIDYFSLSFPTAPGASYTIEGTLDLRQWQVIESEILGNGNIVERRYLPGNPIRIFRVKRQ